MSTHTIYHFQYKKENHPKLSKICSYGFLFQGTQERVRNSRGKRAISVRATEVLLYIPHKLRVTVLVNTVSIKYRDILGEGKYRVGLESNLMVRVYLCDKVLLSIIHNFDRNFFSRK